MPRQTITYDVLFSCPGDVVDQIDLVRDAVNSFNETVGLDNNVVLMLRHWSTSSYAESGKGGQESINDQFVKCCDVAIAIFGDRFGSPTDKYQSGTEEEIEMFLKYGKQVFMLFYEGGKSCNADLDQLKKVREFKEKYKEQKKGVIISYPEKKDLKDLLKNNLEMWYFRNEKGKKNISEKKKESEGNFYFRATNLETMSDNIVLSDMKFPFDLEKNQADIKEEIKKIAGIGVETTSANVDEFEQICIVKEQDKNVIIQYAEKNNISLPEDFFSLGGLKYGFMNFLEGTEGEKDKKELIECLAIKVKKTEVRKYFVEKLKNVKLLWGAVINNTDSEGDGVCITFEMKKKNFCFPKDVFMNVPKLFRDVVNQKFLKNTIPNINISSYSFHCGNLFDTGYPSDKEYVNVLNHFFNYTISEVNDKICLNYTIENIKISDMKYIPLPIFFSETSEDIIIDYKIRTSNNERCFKGTLIQ